MDDPELRKKLEENKRKADSNMEKVCDGGNDYDGYDADDDYGDCDGMMMVTEGLSLSIK